MKLHYSPEYEDIIFATRFLSCELSYIKTDTGLKLEKGEEHITILKEILSLLQSEDDSQFLTDSCISKLIKESFLQATLILRC